MVSIDLSGKTALVTGGSGQLGRVMVRRLAQAGAAVLVHYNQNGEKAEALVRELEAAGTRAAAVQAGQQRGSGRRLSDAALLVRNRNHGGRHVPCTPFTHLRPEQSRFSHLFVRKIEILS